MFLLVCLWEQKQEETLHLFERGIICTWCCRRTRIQNLTIRAFALVKPIGLYLWPGFLAALYLGVCRVHLKIPVNAGSLLLSMEHGLHLTPYLLRPTLQVGRLMEISYCRRRLPPMSGVGALILATMNSLAVQSSARMVGDLCYAATHTYALMVVAVDRVLHAGMNQRRLKHNCIVACDKAALEDQVATLGDRSKQIEDQWMLEKGVVRVIDKVIESIEFANGIRGVCEAYEALGFEKGKRMGGHSASVREPKVPDPSRVARRIEKVDVTLSSLAETDFAGLFHLGEMDYDDFC
ncbi:unnamed protein product [Lactuca saligna]|uniref:Uncharacterized protein n=1 Tax=Lactuca saligna TaxID=75948 RepID=A0AA36EN46_LACSI|nr:unnamed protein product [Lactuca saligna]